MGPSTICIVRNKAGTVSETFIDAQIAHLPARIIVAFGADLPRFVLRAGKAEPLVGSGDVNPLDAFADLLRTEDVEVVLAHFGQIGAAILESCQSAGVPLVTHFHGYDAYQESILSEHRAAYQALFKSGSLCVVPSQHMRQHLLKLGAQAGSVRVNAYGVEIPDLDNEQWPLSATRSCLSVGRFVDKKAPALTLLSFYSLLKDFPDLSLDMIGDGYLLESCKDLTEALHIADHVHFHGALPNSAVRTFYKARPIFLHHSVTTRYGDSEGLPVALLEAMSFRLPIVATHHAGIPEAITDGASGILVAERSLEEMSAGVSRILQDSSLASKLGDAAGRQAIERFSLNRSIAGLYDVLSQAVNSKALRI